MKVFFVFFLFVFLKTFLRGNVSISVFLFSNVISFSVIFICLMFAVKTQGVNVPLLFVTGILFVSVFGLLFLINLAGISNSVDLIVNGIELVHKRQITAAGYIFYFKNSIIDAALVALFFYVTRIFWR